MAKPCRRKLPPKAIAEAKPEQNTNISVASLGPEAGRDPVVPWIERQVGDEDDEHRDATEEIEPGFAGAAPVVTAWLDKARDPVRRAASAARIGAGPATGMWLAA